MKELSSRLFLLILLIAFTFVVSHGQKRLITVRVVDNETKKPLAEIELSRGDTTVRTNILGFFQLKANTGDSIIISNEGYGTKMILVPEVSQFLIGLDKTPNTDKVYREDEVDQAPEPEVGFVRFYSKWASSNDYPKNARRMGIQGTVKIFYVVGETGEIIESGIIEGFNKECDEAALSSFRKLILKWKPGVKDGNKVNVIMITPFKFKLG